MAREKQIIGMNTSSWIEEDSEGRPLRAGQTQTGGGSSVRMNWTWFENGIRERRIQGSSINERELPAISTQALPPMAAQRAIKAVSEGQIDFSLLLLDPSQGVAPALNRRQKNGRVQRGDRWTFRAVHALEIIWPVDSTWKRRVD